MAEALRVCCQTQGQGDRHAQRTAITVCQGRGSRIENFHLIWPVLRRLQAVGYELDSCAARGSQFMQPGRLLTARNYPVLSVDSLASLLQHATYGRTCMLRSTEVGYLVAARHNPARSSAPHAAKVFACIPHHAIPCACNKPQVVRVRSGQGQVILGCLRRLDLVDPGNFGFSTLIF